MLDFDRLTAAYEKAKGELLAERTPQGHWIGELSSSALATATAVSALAVAKTATSGRGFQSRDNDEWDDLIRRGVAYLVKQQNDDGGFGDTDLSHSNIATTYLVVAALHLAGVAEQHADLLKRADAYLESKGRLEGLRKRYGIDKTFVVPIMTNLALAGLIDWREIDPLPFELACVPQAWYRFVGMPVVSYAIPALVAIGQARYHHAPPWNPITRLVRWLSITRSLRVLRRMQPDSGGYLEATPLTAFVVMSLGSLHAPREDGITRSVMPTMAADVIRAGVKFLIDSIRPDGSWPIDTNLATWNTTLAINALAGAGEDVAELLAAPSPPATLPQGERGEGTATTGRGFGVLDWLLSCQHTKRHPFTGADPGGFGWTDLSGAVPDADDTPGAILAIGSLVTMDSRLPENLNVVNGPLVAGSLTWLVYLQNHDGGWPTFCRGWGKLPFDRSGTDLTAHALRAIAVTGKRFKAAGDLQRAEGSKRLLLRIGPSACEFLTQRQHPDGSWSPLWFGNQDHPEEDNPVYGTAKVLMAYRDLGLMDSPEAQRGVAWLVGNQNADGGWGSGVWGRIQNAEFIMQNGGPARSAELGAPSGVEVGDSVTDSGNANHSVLGTQYPVPSTRQDDAMPAQSQNPAPNPKSKIQNLKSSIEETALAVEALLAAIPSPQPPAPSPAAAAVEKGLNWLLDRVDQNQHRQPAPIGFYFAKLWYYERLYPLTFTVAALGRACRQFAHPQPDQPAAPTSLAAASDTRAP